MHLNVGVACSVTRSCKKNTQNNKLLIVCIKGFVAKCETFCDS